MRRSVRAALVVAVLAVASGVAPSPTYAAERVANPFAGAVGYVDPDWSQHVRATAVATAGPLGAAMDEVATQPTAIWLDRIATITEGRGLRGHLDAALAQQHAAGEPVVVSLVLFDLPERNCEDGVDNGELFVEDDGLNRYRTQFIDPIAAILADPAYANLRIAVIIEPDSLTALLRGVNRVFECDLVAQTGVYQDGIAYALAKLQPISNVYRYLDAGNAGLVGWDSLAEPLATALATVAARTPAGLGGVDGVITNTADYSPVTEPFLTSGMSVSGVPIYQSRFYDWNPFVDEAPFALTLRNALIAKGFSGQVGVLLDTSRNGWGGPARPTQASTSRDVNWFVDESRVDRRIRRTDYCNQAGAGIGERPRANPAPNLAAFVWARPPGISDGISDRTALDTGGQPADPMCDPTYTGPPDAVPDPSGALPNAPRRGEFFPSQFAELVRNAFPPLL